MGLSTSTLSDVERVHAPTRRCAALVLGSLLLGACQAKTTRALAPQDPRGDVIAPGATAEPVPTILATPGLEVEPSEPWWHPTVDFRYPFRIGFADFDFGDGEALDSVTAVSFIPTADFYFELDREWTLIPFLGLGGGWLIDDSSGILIASTGVRALYVHALDSRTSVRVQPRLRYDVNMNQPDGLLGDLGQTDLVLELRHALGAPEDTWALEPGLYGQGFWFWDDIEFEVPGLTPDSIENQLEFGVSLAPRNPITVLGFELPRVFVGYRFGNSVRILEIRFGEL